MGSLTYIILNRKMETSSYFQKSYTITLHLLNLSALGYHWLQTFILGSKKLNDGNND